MKIKDSWLFAVLGMGLLSTAGYTSVYRLDVPVPFAFRYSPAKVERFPWIRSSYSAGDLPLLALSNADDLVATAEHWNSRDTVFVESAVHGTVLLAELLLNAGCRWNPTAEYDLESEAGCRGVAPMSAELKLILPGSTAWIFEGDDLPAVAPSGS